jgi:flagellar biosynthesis anti-sigma factor FlgM
MTVPINSTDNNTRVTSRVLSEVKPNAANRHVAPALSPAAASARFESSLPGNAAQDIDSARVAEIRQAISEGKLQLHPERIAEAIIASARELVSGSH